MKHSKLLLRLTMSVILGVTTSDALAESNCNPLARNTCAVPFPSNFWAVDDAASPTGLRLSVSNDILRDELFEQLPIEEGISPEGIFTGSSGFSAASAALFELGGVPDIDTLPKDGGSAVQAFNLNTGERLPLRAQISPYALSDKVSEPVPTLEIYPRTRWPFGETTLVVVTKELSVDMAAGDFEDALGNAQPGTPEAGYLNELAGHIQQSGIALSDVRSATLFTTRTRGEVVDPIRTLVDRAYDTPQQVRNLDVQYKYLNSDTHALVTGELQLMNYRLKGGEGAVDFDASPATQWTTFRLTLPSAAKKGQVPVALYAHGLGGSKSMDSLVTSMNADLGMATLSIDFPNHGDRAERDGGGVFENLTTTRITTQIGMVNQNAIDFAAAHSALINSLSELDIARPASFFNWWGIGSDGVPDLDTSRVMMQGTSLGGVLGMAYASLSPDLDAGLFQVTGSGITSILADSILWDSQFSGLVPPAANGAEALLMKTAIQHALDHGDPINYVDLIRYPESPREERPTLILAGAGDAVVNNDATIATANLLDLPLVGQKLFDMPGIEQADDYEEGFGVRHYEPIVNEFFGDTVSRATAHGIFLRNAASKDSEAWMKKYFLR